MQQFHTILFEEGVQQGDSGGSTFYALGSLKFIKEAASIIGDTGFLKALIDDITFGSNHQESLDVLAYLITTGPELGFKINPIKTKILLGKCDTNGEALSRKCHYQQLLNISLEQADKTILIHPDNIPAGVDYNGKYGVELLGSPVGSDQYTLNWLTKNANLQKESLSILNH